MNEQRNIRNEGLFCQISLRNYWNIAKYLVIFLEFLFIFYILFGFGWSFFLVYSLFMMVGYIEFQVFEKARYIKNEDVVRISCGLKIVYSNGGKFAREVRIARFLILAPCFAVAAIIVLDDVFR